MDWPSRVLLLVAICAIVIDPQVDATVKGSWSQDYINPNLVYGGQEGEDLSPTYVCRAGTAGTGGVTPGKYVPGIVPTCFISNGKKEEGKTSFQVLIDNSYQWVKAGTNGVIPPNAVEGGFKSSGEQLYVCRTGNENVRKFLWTGKAMLVGATRKDLNKCFASWAGEAKSYSNFEILVKPIPKRLGLFDLPRDDSVL